MELQVCKVVTTIVTEDRGDSKRIGALSVQKYRNLLCVFVLFTIITFWGGWGLGWWGLAN